jgi:hypothetical protein
MPSDDSMRSRVPGNRVKLWLLLGANRWAVAGLLLTFTFAALAVLVAIDPVPLGDAIAASDPTETLFQAMITSIVTGVTLVVTINQVVLSQELGAVGDQRDRMSGSLSFRDDVAEKLEEPVAPPEPAAFLHALLGATADRARAFREAAVGAGDAAEGSGDAAVGSGDAAVGSGDAAAGEDGATSGIADPDVREAAETFADELIENAETVRDELDGATFGTFEVVQAALGFNYSLKIYEGKRLQATYGGGAPEEERLLDEAADDALADTVDLLESFGPAREHVKTLYFQWELVNLSRAMLYAAIPSLAVAIGALLTLGDAASIGGSTLGVANQSWTVLLAATVSVTPFALLVAYVLRIATVTKRTLAMGPFVLRDTATDDES